ncbi:MAG: hypothetical protein O9325_13440 [Roseomonas sp.]|nr:hypothetical protein [Roseomonas sp.]
MLADADITAAGTPDDHAALLPMLAYVEAECRWLGAEAAAALVPGPQPQPGPRDVH